MNKFIAASAALLMSFSLAVPAFANDSATSVTTSADTTVASVTDLACMAAAVDAREAAVITARTNFDAKIIAALNTRRASLKTAYTIGNNADRKVAVKAAMTAFAKSVADARTQYKTDVKASWKVFTDATKNCNVDATVRVKSESEHDNDHGKHLGQLKNKIKNEFNANANGKLDLDLSF